MVAYLLLTALILGMSVNASVSEKTTYENEVLETLTGLGLLNGIEVSDPYRKITRAEYARVWYNINRLANNIGEENIGGTVTFSDVDTKHDHYNAISYVSSVGLMKGYSSESFGAENPVILGEAIKVIVDFLEFNVVAELSGGYPYGYIEAARRLGIISGGNPDTELTLENVSEIFFQLLFTKTPHINYINDGKSLYENDEGDTFMKKYIGLDVKKGFITDNGITSIYGKTRIASDDIEIDGFRLKAMAENEAFGIGDEVKAYYNKELMAIYVYKSTKTEQIEIDLSDISFISNGKVIFTQNNKDKEISFKENPYVIFNGVLLNEYIWSSFLNYDKGTVKFIKSGNSSVYNVIRIEAYKSFVVSGCERDMKIVYTTDGHAFKFDNSEYTILNRDGLPAGFEDIFAGNVIDIRIYDDTNRTVYKSANTKNVYKLYISNSYKDNLKVTKTYTKNGHSYVSTDDGDYKIDKDYAAQPDYVAPTAGNTYSFYLNKFNEICDIKTSASADYTIGILCNMAKSTKPFEDRIDARLFLPDTGKMPVYQLKEKLKYSDTNGVETTVKATEALTNLTGYSGIIRFRLSEENEISAIELPISDPYTKLSKLHTIVDTSKVDDYGLAAGKGLVYNGSNVANKAFLKSKFTRVICIDKNNLNTSDIERYNVFVPSGEMGIPLSNSVAYNNIKAYTTVPESPLSQYAVIEIDMSEALYTASVSDFAIVKEIERSLDADGNECYKILAVKISNNGVVGEATLTATSDAFENMTTVFNEQVTEELEAGDIIYYRLNGQSIVDRIWHIYDVDGTNAAFPSGRKGTIPGTVGYFDESVDGKTNPLALKRGVIDSNTIQYGELVVYKKGMGRMNIGVPKITSGQIYNYVDGYIKVSTQDFSQMPDISDYDPKFIVGSYELKKPVVVNVYKKNTDVLLGDSLSVRTFKEYGENCSKAVVLRTENKSAIVIYNEF